MPRGIPNKKAEPIVTVGGTEATTVTIVKADKPTQAEVERAMKDTPMPSRTAPAPVAVEAVKELPPAPVGQKYFEAPTGEVMLGDADKDSMLFRPRDGRKPFLINPKR